MLVYLVIKSRSHHPRASATSSYGGIFRDNNAKFLGCCAEFLGNGSSFQAELSGAMRAVEIACEINWRNLWIEIDSTLVVLAFNSFNLH